ncbi:hypothetical protein D7W79_34150 [Corallococcus exercitus]|uniref:hypothetical protein n=1 Tax=Corallococcus exercitus TaxID=2316736 RepID=UPI000EA2E892|nr:hypothetical protein [Corallococcus exercitus]RKG68473.1 hypothetical protein D7W79_34150 [Corallococcus exercitus]
MRSRVLFPLCLTGLLLACASGPRATPLETASSDTDPVQPCSSSTPAESEGGTVVNITLLDDKVHFSSDNVEVQPGHTVTFVSQVNQARCIGLSNGALLKNGSHNPLLVPACGSAAWKVRGKDEPGSHASWWSTPTKGDCSQVKPPQGIKETINGTLEVTGRGED